MNQPTELPIIRLLVMVAAGMFGLLLLIVLCTPMQVHKHRFESLKRDMRELIGQHALFFKWNAGITVGLFLLGRLCLVLGNWFDWQGLTAFGDGCIFFAILSCLGFLRILAWKAEAQQNQRIGQALFGPRTIMKTDIGSLTNYGGNVALGDNGSPINQTAQGNSIVLHQQIHSLIDAVVGSGNELTAHQRSDAVEKLNILADQSMRPEAQREESKIKTALKLLPGLLSSASGLAQAWAKLEPWITAHFGRG